MQARISEKRDSVTPLFDPSRRLVLLLLVALSLASFALYARWVVRPYLAVDDFQILQRSWTWQQTRDGLWEPANEHAMPLGRLTTFGLVRATGGVAAVPYLAALQGPLAVLAGTLLLYLFVRRELGHPFYGLAAAALFGVSTVYEQAVYWFSASFSVVTLDTLLLALLAAQQWRLSRRPVFLALSVLGTALAPAWFASGILAGPLCALYLLLPEGHAAAAGKWWRALVRSALVALVPLLGSALFLAVSLPRTAERIMHLPHYEGETALQAFHPLKGLQYTFWSIVENLLLGQLGISSVNVPFGLAVAVWPMLLVLGAWWWRGAPAGRRQMLLGLGLIFTGYLLVYSARAEWGYAGYMNRPNWSRYHLLPQLGLALFLAAGLPRWAGAWKLRPDGMLRWGQVGALLALVLMLAVVQYQRTRWTPWAPDDDTQLQALRRVDEADAVCRRHRIGVTTAQAVLGWRDIPGGGRRPENRLNCWDFLRGSPDPDPSMTPDEARRVLAPFLAESDDQS
jgi:hypothetical protein